MEKITVNSPAKINIGLNVIGKREDGFHNLETIFYPLLLADNLQFRKSDILKFNSNSDKVLQMKDNLVLRAIDMLENFSGQKFRVDIFLQKNIPIGGGLGGGSSNAASTLKALIKLFDLKINNKKLNEIALSLGSDVPFFINPLPCFAESRGEKLIPIPLSIPNPILIVNPGIHISTKEAFQNVKPALPGKSLKSFTGSAFITLEDLRETAVNDFEEYVFKKHPVIKKIKYNLYEAGAVIALMTGTGSTVFGIFENLRKANWVKDDLSKDFFTFLNYPVDKGSIT